MKPSIKDEPKIYTESDMEAAFEAGRESKAEEIDSNIQEGIIGKDGKYFYDWIEDYKEKLKNIL